MSRSSNSDLFPTETFSSYLSLTSLQRNQVPEWSSHYINYKALKKLIKQLSLDRLDKNQEPAKSIDESEFASMWK